MILGAGSFFEFVVKHSLGIIAFFFLIQIPLIFIDLTDSTSHNMLIAIIFFMNAIIDPLTILFQTLAFFTLPIAGIWSAELNADRFMLTSKIDSTDNPLKVIEKLKKESSLKRWLLSQITHPPNSLRRWMAVHSSEKKSVLLFLFLFPIAHLFQLLMLVIYLLSNYFIAFLFGVRSIQEIVDSLLRNIMLYLDTRSLTWLFFSIVVILWPFIAVYWVRFFSGLRETYNLGNYRSYFLSTFVLLCVFGLSYSV